MKVLILLICVGLTLSARRSYERYILEYAEQYFEEFIKTYNKIYADEAEKQKRFEIFKNNLEILNEQNAKSESAVYGITEFTDLTSEEFIRFHTGLKGGFGKTDCQSPPILSEGTAPESLDWRAKGVVTRIKNQGRCGSCWAFSATGNLESQYAIKHNQTLEFSEQQLVDCDNRSRGCWGTPFLANPFLYWIEKTGPELESDYPYVAKRDACNYDASKVKVNVTGCITYRPESEDKLKELLHHIGPLSIGLDADHLQGYHGNIMTDCKFNSINHAVLLVGYGTENGVPYWLIKNSWGEMFGESGYIRIKRGINACGIANSDVVSGNVA